MNFNDQHGVLYDIGKIVLPEHGDNISNLELRGNSQIIVNSHPARPIRIRNVTFVGPDAGLSIFKTGNLTIKNISFVNTRNGIVVAPKYGWISNVNIENVICKDIGVLHNNSGEAFLIEGPLDDKFPVRNLNVLNYQCLGSPHNAMNLWDSPNDDKTLNIFDCTFKQIYSECGSIKIKGKGIRNNIFEDIYLDGGSMSLMEGCHGNTFKDIILTKYNFDPVKTAIGKLNTVVAKSTWVEPRWPQQLSIDNKSRDNDLSNIQIWDIIDGKLFKTNVA